MNVYEPFCNEYRLDSVFRFPSLDGRGPRGGRSDKLLSSPNIAPPPSIPPARGGKLEAGRSAGGEIK
jgi:hypothetical protein